MLNKIDIFNPTNEHGSLRDMVKKFSKTKLFPNIIERDINEQFDKNIFIEMGKLGILGITAPEEYGGMAMDCTSSLIVHEELAYYDPSIALSYLAHSILCVNNIVSNGSVFQKKNFYLNYVQVTI